MISWAIAHNQDIAQSALWLIAGVAFAAWRQLQIERRPEPGRRPYDQEEE